MVGIVGQLACKLHIRLALQCTHHWLHHDSNRLQQCMRSAVLQCLMASNSLAKSALTSKMALPYGKTCRSSSILTCSCSYAYGMRQH